MRRFTLALLCFSAASLLAAPAWQPAGFITADGPRLIRPDGRPFAMRGINLGNWLLPEGYMFGFKHAVAPWQIEGAFAELVGPAAAADFWRQWRDTYIARDDIQLIRRAGFNCVRVPMDYRFFISPRDPAHPTGPGWALLDRLVGWCRDEGLVVILDLHAAPGGQTGTNIDNSRGYPFLYASAADQTLTIDLWRALARHFRDEPAILGYELLNEPIAPDFDPAKLNPLLEPLYRRITDAIRAVDPHHLVILGGAQWDTNFADFGPPFAPGLVYAFHTYWVDPAPASIQRYLDLRARWHAPILLTESGENTDAWIAAFRALLEREQIGWAFWPYKKLAAASCVATVSPPRDWPAIIAFADAPRDTFDEIKKARPAPAIATHALAELLENIQTAHCRVNAGYLKALGLKAP